MPDLVEFNELFALASDYAHNLRDDELRARWNAAVDRAYAALAVQATAPAPIPMILPCPRCGLLHVDAPEPATGWTNPPHKSHLCHGCGLVWRPADVPTNGVATIATRGSRDTYKPGENPPGVLAVVEVSVEHDEGVTFVRAHLPRDRAWPERVALAMLESGGFLAGIVEQHKRREAFAEHVNQRNAVGDYVCNRTFTSEGAAHAGRVNGGEMPMCETGRRLAAAVEPIK